MSDRTWKFLDYFFISTIIIGAFTLAYFSEKGKLGIIETNIYIRSFMVLYVLCGMFFVILAEVRKRRDGVVDPRAIGITLGIMLVAGIFMFLTRVL